ncbi:MAG: hypothetical protein ACHBN1_11230 [Heteroscytonema crispum UTEX LB 1556]
MIGDRKFVIALAGEQNIIAEVVESHRKAFTIEPLHSKYQGSIDESGISR